MTVPDWVIHPARYMPKCLRGPYITSVLHALLTVVHFLPIGILVYWITGDPTVWLFLSTMAAGFYWGRELCQTDLKPKPKVRADGSLRSFGERWDTWMDAIFPTVALGVLYWIL